MGIRYSALRDKSSYKKYPSSNVLQEFSFLNIRKLFEKEKKKKIYFHAQILLSNWGGGLSLPYNCLI